MTNYIKQYVIVIDVTVLLRKVTNHSILLKVNTPLL